MNKLHEYIDDLKLSYSQVAVDTGYTRSYIRLLAKGERKNPSRDAVEKIYICINKAYEESKKLRKTKLPRPTIDILFYSESSES